MKIGIIGGGAAGLFSAIAIKKKLGNVEVTILERQSRIGKKILSTGNGKCNISNIDASYRNYNNPLVDYALSEFDSKKTLDYFFELGLMTKCDDEGRCYPYSEKASTVVDVLVKNIEELGIKVITDFEVVHIKNLTNFYVYSKDYCLLHFDYIIVATGGKSGITFENNSYKFLKDLGHTITELKPVLVPIKTVENNKPLSGIRVKAKVRLIRNNKIVFETSGEILFKDDGLSGISMLEVSRHCQPKDKISLDLVSDIDDDILRGFLKKEENIYGLVPKMVAIEVLKRGKDYLKTLRDFSFTVKDVYGFDNAQVTKGGVSMNEVNPITFESIIIKRLYLIGEVLDVDGDCGGYNLQFAWSSAYMAARDIVKNVEEQNGN